MHMFVFQYMGRWYEMERYFAIFEFGQKCGTAEYELKEDGLVRVNNTGFNVMWVWFYRIKF